MELYGTNSTLRPRHLGEEKQQMLGLNRRLESYLNRVKLLEEENMMLASEIQERSGQGRQKLQEGLKEQLRQTRLEVDMAWRDRVLAEMEVVKLSEELDDINLQRRRVAEAEQAAAAKMEQSRRELDEEQRAQIWLREKVKQLEHEMRLLTQTHQEDLAHLESTVLTHNRGAGPPALTRRGNQTPELLTIGQEFSQKASRAWQEAAEAYEGQIAQMEESLHQAKSRLGQVNQEKLESRRKIQALEKEIISAQDVKLHLEKSAATRREECGLEMQQLQEHLEHLESEKEHLGWQINQLVQENRSLMQMKMSLGLEVATYRALLDSESLRVDGGFPKSPRNLFLSDAAGPHGAAENYHNRLSTGLKTSSLSSGSPAASAPKRASPAASKSIKPEFNSGQATDVRHAAALGSHPPESEQSKGVEKLLTQESDKEVRPNDPWLLQIQQKVFVESKKEVKASMADLEDPGNVPESVISGQVESGLSSEPCFRVEEDFPATYSFEHSEAETEEQDDYLNVTGKEETQERFSEQTFTHAKEEMEERVEQEELSGSEGEPMFEPIVESSRSSFDSMCGPVEGDDARAGRKGDVGEKKEDVSSSAGELRITEAEEKLYPDGEEMDTWDSVMERKADVKTDGGSITEEQTRHAEPEEDISVREQEQVMKEVSLPQHEPFSPVDERQQATSDREPASPPGEEDEEQDEEEDSQNVSVSWKTELESDSYAQDNTLADTRPLIRYKSDETEANAQESESSDCEQERRAGAWSEGKSKTFGTMEDLCEEVEDEAVEDIPDAAGGRAEHWDMSLGAAMSEQEDEADDAGGEDRIDRYVREVDSEEETEEESTPREQQHEDKEEELERVSSGGHSQLLLRAVSEGGQHLEHQDVEQHVIETNISPSEKSVPLQHMSSGVAEDEMNMFSKSQAEPVGHFKVEDMGHESEMKSTPDQDMSEDLSDFRDFITRSDVDEISDAPNPMWALTGQGRNFEDLPQTPGFHKQTPEEHLRGEDEKLYSPPKDAEEMKWEFLKDYTEESRIRTYDQTCLTQTADDDDDGVKRAELTHKKDIFIMDASSKGAFPVGKSEFWVSSLESGATYEPDDTSNEADGPAGQIPKPDDNRVPKSMENGNFEAKTDSALTKSPAEAKKTFGRSVVEGEMIHSEESEGDTESWSSGEEEGEPV